ncbi:hypothetical protein BpHYR1_017699 [Brachionus plicatilis]|uniref:UBX domain-containing protein n=1 Tax=Brachionus plicatilis TaxID=10195 RepID=A0A3M7S8T1_BRAPC|nr:hypothetical protein BpHYR1_017699 [Brachionus plicatilis]
MNSNARPPREKPFIPKPPNTPRNSVPFNNKKIFEKNLLNETNTDHLDDILNLTPSPRPLSASLSRFQTLPKIGTKPEPKYLIGFRLPDGSRTQGHFNKNDKISILLEFAFEEYSKIEPSNCLSNFTLIQMPSLVLKELDQTINSYEIKDKSMLFLISKDQAN